MYLGVSDVFRRRLKSDVVMWWEWRVTPNPPKCLWPTDCSPTGWWGHWEITTIVHFDVGSIPPSLIILYSDFPACVEFPLPFLWFFVEHLGDFNLSCTGILKKDSCDSSQLFSLFLYTNISLHFFKGLVLGRQEIQVLEWKVKLSIVNIESSFSNQGS